VVPFVRAAIGMVGMLPNAVDVNENQARQLVHWILDFDR
jgi:hypothetical protein